MSYEHFARWRDEPESITPVLSVVIPAFNESERIVPTIASIAAHLATVRLSFEIIVSDDGSTDSTAELCMDLGLRNLVVVGDGVNRGKGAAVKAGVEAATGQWILFTDADLSTPIEEINRLLAFRDEAEIVIGSRAMADSDEGERSRVRSALSAASRRIVAAVLGLDIADSQCGFKLFSRRAAQDLFGRQRTQGFGFDAEILFLAARHDYEVIEVPVRWIDAPGSTVDPLRAPIEFLLDLIKVRWRNLRGQYDIVPRAGLRAGVVTALPPSTATLTEYGEHLVANMSRVQGVDEVVVFAEDSNGTPDSYNNVTVVPAWSFDSHRTALRLVRAVRMSRPDVVLFNLHFTSFGSRKVAAALGLMLPMILRILGTPTVVLTHNLVDTTDLGAAGYGGSGLKTRVLTGIGRALTRLLLRANHVVTTMPEYVDVLRERYGADNVSLTPHGAFECPPLRTEDELPRSILAFGKFGTYKRVDDLIEAYRILRSRPGNEDVRLVIAGTDSPVTPGYLAEVEARCGDLDGIEFTGYVEEHEIAELFYGAGAVVFPYTGTTGSSGPLHQAGSYGRAVIAPRIGDFVDLIEEEGYDAMTFEPGNVESLVRAIDAVIGDPTSARRMGARNHAAALGLPLSDIAEWHVAHLRLVAVA